MLKDRIGVNLPIFVSGNLVIRYKFTFAVSRKNDALISLLRESSLRCSKPTHSSKPFV